MTNKWEGMKQSWGPQGVEFATFHLQGTDVRVLRPSGDVEDVQVEILSGALWLDGNDTRRSDVLRLSKPVARALASAIMGAAARPS